MFRLATAAVLGSAALLLSGCSLFSQEHKVSFEVTGTAGSAGDVTYATPGNPDVSERNVRAPWSKAVTTEFGIHRVVAKPTAGALTCRIVADGKEIVKVEGEPGEPVTCSKIVNDK